jgi:hypothetical protein
MYMSFDSLLPVKEQFLVHKMMTRKIFKKIEKDLGEFIDNVPNCISHENVFSPVCRDIINRSCNEIDSLCKDVLLKEYFNITIWKKGCFSKLNAPNIYTSLFFLDSLVNLKSLEVHYLTWDKFEQVNPFATGIQRPKWWDAHNKLKHNRVQNIKLATYRNALDSVIALNIVIIILFDGSIYFWKNRNTPEIHQIYFKELLSSFWTFSIPWRSDASYKITGKITPSISDSIPNLKWW